jgi:vancomycin resistance protein YoaR
LIEISKHKAKPTKRLLFSFESVFKTDQKDARVNNIVLGAQKLDGSILKPGIEWSFNKTVGKRTKENGFEEAPVIVMGELLQDVGGGMCQVSSTTFAAALNAGIEITQRYPHSRPSTYIERGFDATVNFPEECWVEKPDPNICFDLKLKNPYDFPITIKTNITNSKEENSKKLRIELWGKGPIAKVETKWRSYSTSPSGQRYRRMWRPGTWKKKKQMGKDGLKGARSIDITWPDGKKEHKRMISNYKPVDEIWWVGRDWPEEKTPWE